MVIHDFHVKEVVDAKTILFSGWVYSKGVKKILPQPHEVIIFPLTNSESV